MNTLTDGSYAFAEEMNIPGEGEGYFVFVRGWLLEIVDLTSGDYYFFSDNNEVRAKDGRRFGVFYPFFSLVRSFIRNADGCVRGIGSVEMVNGLPDKPIIFETEFDGKLFELCQAVAIIDAASNRRSIEVNTAPSLLSIRAKRLIDENYLVFPSIARIAARLKVSHAHLSRQFKRDYGLSPSEYLHHLRVADATFRLSLGQEIVDISYDVGYNDLSRFYKQFRKKTATSPAICRTILGKRA